MEKLFVRHNLLIQEENNNLMDLLPGNILAIKNKQKKHTNFPQKSTAQMISMRIVMLLLQKFFAKLEVKTFPLIP